MKLPTSSKLISTLAAISVLFGSGVAAQGNKSKEFPWALERTFLVSRTSAAGSYVEFPQPELLQIHELVTEQYDLDRDGIPFSLWVPPGKAPVELRRYRVRQQLAPQFYLVSDPENRMAAISMTPERIDEDERLRGWFFEDGDHSYTTVLGREITVRHFREFPRFLRSPETSLTRQQFVELLKQGHQFTLVMLGRSTCAACPIPSHFVRIKPHVRFGCSVQNPSRGHKIGWVIYRVRWE